MTKKIFLVAIAVFIFAARGVYSAEYIDSSVIDEISYFAKKAGFSKKFNRMALESPSRLEWATFLNEVYWTIETKNISLEKSDDERLESLVKYFDKEFMLINISAKLEEKSFFNLGAEFSLNSDYLWGDGVQTSVVSLFQQLRLIFSVRKKNTLGYLALRNFGYWGVNEYSSGSLGINYKTSDPPSIEQVFVESGDKTKLTVGRKYFKYGIWGLAVNWLYSPLDLIEASFSSEHFSSRLAAASRYENIDYLLASLGYKAKFLEADLNGFYSAINTATLENLQSDAIGNDMGAALSLSLFPFDFMAFKNEGAIYKKNADDKGVYPLLTSVEFDFVDFGFSCRYGRIPESRFPRYGAAQPPLDFISQEYAAARFSQKTEGYNLMINLKYAAPLFIEAEYTDLKGIDEEVRYAKQILRGLYRPSEQHRVIDRAILQVSLSDYSASDGDALKEWRAETQLAVKF